MVKLSALLRKKTGRSIKNNWGQFLAIIGITALATTLFLGLFASAQSFESRVNKFYDEGNIADIWVTTERGNRETNNKLMSYSKGQAEERGIMQTLLNSKTSYAIICKKYPTICKPVTDEKINKTGDYLIVDERIANQSIDASIKPGDTVSISFPMSQIATSLQEQIHNFKGTTIRYGIFPIEVPGYNDWSDGMKENIDSYFDQLKKETPTLDFVVTNTMKFTENIQNGSYSIANYMMSYHYLETKVVDYISDSYDINDAGDYAEYIKLLGQDTKAVLNYILNYKTDGTTTSQKLSTMISNQVLLKLDDDQDIEKVKGEIKSYLESENIKSSVVDINQSPFNAVIQADIVQAKQLTYVFPFIFFFVAILVVCTTISQLILKERTQIGTMKALGLSKQRILMHYMSLMIALVSSGLIIGAFVGPLMIPKIMAIKYEILYTLPTMKYLFPVVPFIGSTIVVVGITALVVWVITKHELKLSPAQSMRPAVKKSLKTREDKASRIKSSRFFSWKMAFRNIRLNIIKSLMVVIGVGGCTALLVCGFGIDDTLKYGTETDLTIYYNSDVILTYDTGSLSKYDDIKNVKGVDITRFDEMTTYSTTLEMNSNLDSSVFVVSETHPYFKVEFDKEKIAMSNKVAESLDAKVGDVVTFQILGVEYTGTIGTIYESFSKHGIIVNGVSDQYKQLAETKTSAWIYVKEGYTAEQVAKNLKNNVIGISSYSTQQGTVDYINEIMSSISYMTLTVKVFAVLLAIVVLYNLIYLNFKERMRDMATLKVLGFTNREIALSLIYETMFLVLIGAIIGCFLGYPVEYLVLSINNTAIVQFLYTVFASTYVLSFAISFATALLLNIALSLFIKKVKMVESLKSVE